LLHPLQQLREAIDMCDQVLEITEFDDERVDALLIKFEALVALGEPERAKQVLATLPDPPYGSSAHCYLAGRAHYDAGDIERAGALFDSALEMDPNNADAHYHLALLAEERGDRHAACGGFLRTRQLELEMGIVPWAPNAEAFMLFTEQAVKKLDAVLLAYAERAELYIADVPGPEMVVDGVDPRSVALVDAVLLPTEAGELPAAVEPETTSVRVFLYALNILRAAGALHAVESTIHEALETELRQTLDELRLELLVEQEPVSTTHVVVG
jgi:tetratricopeptide (TPR) repeat protein